MKKPARLCIFCCGSSGAPISKEHVFPNWLRKVFPISPEDTHTHGKITWVTVKSTIERVINSRKKQGQAITRTVRFVCEKCNNGWMSNLEERAQPLLQKLIFADQINIDKEARALLATWAAKTAMTAEYVDPSKVAVTQNDRSNLLANLTPPTGWWIWIAGNQGGNWQVGLYHFSGKIIFSEKDLETPHDLNFQTTTISLGHLLINVISAPPLMRFELTTPNTSDLKPLWPEPVADISWPPSTFLTDTQIEDFLDKRARAFGVGQNHSDDLAS